MKIIYGILPACFFVIPLGACVWMFMLFAPPDVTVHADNLPRDIRFYADAILVDDPDTSAYIYERNTYLTIPGFDTTSINVANESNQLPVFRFGDSAFVILHKGRNHSRGLALSPDISEIAKEHNLFEFELLDGDVYYWEFDGQRDLK